MEDFESFEEGDSDGCDYDANIDPTTISFHFKDKEIQNIIFLQTYNKKPL